MVGAGGRAKTTIRRVTNNHELTCPQPLTPPRTAPPPLNTIGCRHAAKKKSITETKTARAEAKAGPTHLLRFSVPVVAEPDRREGQLPRVVVPHEDGPLHHLPLADAAQLREARAGPDSRLRHPVARRAVLFRLRELVLSCRGGVGAGHGRTRQEDGWLVRGGGGSGFGRSMGA